MKREVVTCDVCGKEREDLTEQWFKVGLFPDPVESTTVRLICEKFRFRVEGKDACGDICALRLIGRWLEHGNFEDGEPRPAREP